MLLCSSVLNCSTIFYSKLCCCLFVFLSLSLSLSVSLPVSSPPSAWAQWLQEWLVELFLGFHLELCLLVWFTCPLLSLFLPHTHFPSHSPFSSLLLAYFHSATSTRSLLHPSIPAPPFFSSPWVLLSPFSLLTWLLLLLSLFLLSTWLSALPLSLSLYLSVPGAMANHLITNALLRPHGTNNPYNTLLGDSAVYNNPAVGMYNTQGVPDVPIIST